MAKKGSCCERSIRSYFSQIFSTSFVLNQSQATVGTKGDPLMLTKTTLATSITSILRAFICFLTENKRKFNPFFPKNKFSEVLCASAAYVFMRLLDSSILTNSFHEFCFFSRYYTKSAKILEKYENISSFHAIRQECDEIIVGLISKLESQLGDRGASPRQLSQAVELLLQLGQPPSKLCAQYLTQ